MCVCVQEGNNNLFIGKKKRLNDKTNNILALVLSECLCVCMSVDVFVIEIVLSIDRQVKY